MSDDIDAMIEEILVDAYGEDEQLWAIRQIFEDEAVFPFPAEVVGSPVEVVGVDYEGDEGGVWSPAAAGTVRATPSR